jgi:hypothetical protein
VLFNSSGTTSKINFSTAAQVAVTIVRARRGGGAAAGANGQGGAGGTAGTGDITIPMRWRIGSQRSGPWINFNIPAHNSARVRRDMGRLALAQIQRGNISMPAVSGSFAS